MPEKRVYEVRVRFDGRWFERVVISDHYEERHQASMNDDLILGILGALGGRAQEPNSIGRDGYRYFVFDQVLYQERPYRIVVTYHPLESFLGVVNAFRRPYVES